MSHPNPAAQQSSTASPTRGALLRVGVPEPGGHLVDVAREAGLPVLFSANAFMHKTDGEVVRVQRPDRTRFGQLDAALDSAGYVASALYGGYPWTVDQYLDLVQAFPWRWYSAMDLACEPEIASDDTAVLFRIAETCRLFSVLSRAAHERGLPSPVPVIQGYQPAQYAWCVEQFPIVRWPDLVGIGSVCRRPLTGPNGVLAILDTLDGLLPRNVRFHFYGLKGSALSVIGQHPRLASVDSMAWDYAARRAHPTGRSVALRGSFMLDWAARNRRLAAGWHNELEAGDAFVHYLREGGPMGDAADSGEDEDRDEDGADDAPGC